MEVRSPPSRHGLRRAFLLFRRGRSDDVANQQYSDQMKHDARLPSRRCSRSSSLTFHLADDIIRGMVPAAWVIGTRSAFCRARSRAYSRSLFGFGALFVLQAALSDSFSFRQRGDRRHQFRRVDRFGQMHVEP
jgi:hypothetical protein